MSFGALDAGMSKPERRFAHCRWSQRACASHKVRTGLGCSVITSYGGQRYAAAIKRIRPVHAFPKAGDRFALRQAALERAS
jgi:hypothetical protein